MEFVDGQNLKLRLRNAAALGGVLASGDVVEIMRGLLRGLSWLHQEKISHRDIKPENIMIRGAGGGDLSSRVVIVDLGLSKVTREGTTGTTVTELWVPLGTLQYASPEQVSGSNRLDLGVDVWASGVVYFEMLAGERPFVSSNAFELMNQIKFWQTPVLNFMLGEGVITFVGVALQKDSRKR
ncbi:kinase-like domain-containing protein, partial [Baffinella frigidus]